MDTPKAQITSSEAQSSSASASFIVSTAELEFDVDLHSDCIDIGLAVSRNNTAFSMIKSISIDWSDSISKQYHRKTAQELADQLDRKDPKLLTKIKYILVQYYANR